VVVGERGNQPVPVTGMAAVGAGHDQGRLR
jgi:hypothetical protein